MGSKTRIPHISLDLPARVAFVCFSRSFGGLEMTTVRLAALLSGRGSTVRLIVPPGSPMQHECEQRGLPWSPLEPSLTYGDVRAAFALRQIFRRHQIDIALFFRSQDIHLGALASIASPGTRIVFYQQMQSGIAKKDIFHRAVFSRLSAWLTLTGIMRDEVLKWTTMPSSRIHVAYLGRDENAFQPSLEKRRRARRSLNIPQGAFVAGVLGRLDRQKGQLEFLESLPAVIDRIPRSYYLIAGDETKNDPGMRSMLEQRIRDLDIGRSVHLLPPTADVPAFLSALDVFVMPSYSETYGLVLIEAMAMGLPVISTNSGGVPELVRNGQDGLIVEPKNVEQLSKALSTLGRSPVLCRRYGTSGRRRFETSFRETACIDNLVSILRDTLQR